MTDVRDKLKDIVAGLEGVTRGPWHEMHAKRDTGSMITRIGADPDGTVIARAFDRPEYGELGKVNGAHIARCSPDTMREIGTLVDELELGKAGLEIDYHEAKDRAYAYGRECKIKDAEIELLRVALCFYAEKDRYDYDETCCWFTVTKKRAKELKFGVLEDGGQVARAALNHKELI